MCEEWLSEWPRSVSNHSPHIYYWRAISFWHKYEKIFKSLLWNSQIVYKYVDDEHDVDEHFDDVERLLKGQS